MFVLVVVGVCGCCFFRGVLLLIVLPVVVCMCVW